jgi:small subunit ribosomal protein S2
MPYITERWPGGMLTNFVTIRKAVKKMGQIDRMKTDGSFNALSKREKLQIDRQRAKLEKNLGSIADMTRLPGAVFVVDTRREHIAIAEAQKLNIPIFAMVDTNCDPKEIDFVVPANDDASKSIDVIMTQVTDAVAEGLAERKSEKSEDTQSEPEVAKVAEAAESSEAVVEAPKVKIEKPAEAKSKKDVEEEEPVVEEAPKADEKKPEKAKKSSSVKATEDGEKAAPKKTTKAKADKGDDLTKVEGIGPKAAEALVNAGIGSYADLAKAKPEKIKEILAEASSRMAHLDPTSWPKQAKMAADDKWDQLKEWQEKAKGGKE